MSQAQTQSKPPPLREGGYSAEDDQKAKDHAEFFHQLRHGSDDASPEPREDRRELPQPAPRLSELGPRPTASTSPPPEVHAAYHRTDTNVYQLETVRHDSVPADSFWQQNEPLYHVGMEPRRGRPRHPRRLKPVPAKNHYRTGQVIATFFALMGWLMVAAGVAAALVFIFLPEASTRVGLPNLLGGAAGVLIVGLLTVAMGLAARALFDQANAMRELVAMQQRARLGVEPY
jgi:hypothetical protein